MNRQTDVKHIHPAGMDDTGHTHAGGIPAGTIAIWSLLNGAIPTGWVECDGTANAPGPDLRGRFPVGRDAGHPVDTTGGATTHTHGGHMGHAGHGSHAAHADHVFTQPATHGDHTGIISHTHKQKNFPTATGASDGHTRDTSMSGTALNSGLDTDIPVGALSSYPHAAHSGGAVDIHDNHDAHTSHTVHSAHDTPNSEPSWFGLIFIQKT